MTVPPNRPPPVFPLRRPTKSGPFRRTPPAIFPAVLGLLGLGLAWRQGAAQFGLPAGVVEAFLGAMTLLWIFAVAAYAGKAVLRAGVIADDLRILPGQDGLAALAMTVPAVTLVVLPYQPVPAAGLMLAGIALHLLLIGGFAAVLRAGPAAARGVTPVWQTMLGGIALGALPALALGWAGLAVVLAVLVGLAAGAVWLISAGQLIRHVPPAPLRPLLVLHLAPAALLGLAAQGLEWAAPAQGFAVLGGAILLALALCGRWVLQSGPTPFWGALTFPLAAYAALLLTLGGVWRLPGALLLVVATLVILPLACRLLQDWIKGSLAARTNAAEA